MNATGNKHSLVELIEIITRVIGEIEIQFIKSLEEAGLTAKQLNYLEAINRLKHPSLSELAQELDLSKPSVTAIIDRFETQDYVERVKSDEDRRSAHVHIKKKGKEIVAMHARTHQGIARFFSKNLEKNDLDLLVSLLNKVVVKNEQHKSR